MAWIAVAVGGTAAAGSIMASQAANEAAADSQRAVMDRFQLNAKIADQMLQEQQSNVFEQMTEVNKQFLAAKGKMTVAQAESGVTGNTAKRLALKQRVAASDARGKIMQEADTNAVNIANDMLGKQMDVQAQMQKLENQKKSTAAIMIDAANAGASGALAGANLYNSFSDLGGNQSANTIKGS